jgi:hypothetical protein
MRIHIDGVDRDMTDQELTEYETVQELSQQDQARAAAEQAAKKEQLTAIAEKLGLTLDQLKAAFGV